MSVPAQRLWVLDRGEDQVSEGHRNVCRFMGAVTVLRDTAVYVVFVMSPDVERASETFLSENGTRLFVERQGFRFATLDEAIMWAEWAKRDWLNKGWTEVLTDPDECG